ncbi:hypothetical protein [Pleionea sediminis]|uniref:hypothetical protein n=1 Tax=Pleionea sediminis TaxID=2569479 RepID=UPI001184EDC1|nr:hypothetical protein [Pleionea sediminis]
MRLAISRLITWSLVIGFFISSLLWSVLSPNERESRKADQQILTVTTSALQQAVIFSHMKFHAVSANKLNYIDLVKINDFGLDFNKQGFPIGTSHSENSITLPVTTNNCREIWNALLVVMQPMLEPEAQAKIRVKSLSGVCHFRSIKFPEHSILYNPKSGKVSLKIRS